MLVLMLDFKYKNMWLVNIYLGCEIIATLGVKDNEQMLLPLLLEVYKLLVFNGVQNIVTIELGSFHHYHIDLEIYNCVVSWWWTKRAQISHCDYINTKKIQHPN